LSLFLFFFFLEYRWTYVQGLTDKKEIKKKKVIQMKMDSHIEERKIHNIKLESSRQQFSPQAITY
jgi:acid stress-induced BolA-like protein IbaG/YrbA